MTVLSGKSGFVAAGADLDPRRPPPNGWQAQRLEFVQTRTAVFRRLHVSQTLFLRIVSGSKEVRCDASDGITADPGWFVCLRRGEDLTVLNRTGASGEYRAEALVIPDDIIANTAHPGTRGVAGGERGAKMSPEFEAAFALCLASAGTSSVPQRVFHHRIAELCLWAEELGIAISTPQDRSLTARLRALIETDREYSWTASTAAHMLGMSEATMRRSLNREGSRFSSLLQDVRVSFALMRIQTSRDSLARIAYESGFSSQARLNETFRRRFDMSPGSLRASGTC